jgi:HD-like signal output (HDOD) protein
VEPGALPLDSNGVRGSSNEVAFAFVRALATELSRGEQELPGYPAVVARIQQVVNDNNADISRLVAVIGYEPVIAAQIVRMANSAALNPGGVPVADLRTAVTRVGFDAVRSAAIAFAVGQLRRAPEMRGLEQQLEALWRRSVQVASLCQAMARRFSRLNPEAAMLAGLLQGIGKLYILARASGHRALFADEQAYRMIEQTWHVSIATALLESWGIAPEIVEAVRESEDFLRETRGPATLSDVLMVAALLADFDGTPDTLRATLQSARPCQRLQLDYQACEAFLTASAQELATLREALSLAN